MNELEKYKHFNTLRPISEWGEDYGDCLFWNIENWEVIVGNMLDSNWNYINKDNYYTHFTRIMNPIMEGE